MKARANKEASSTHKMSVAEYLAREQQQDLLRFITCGSVDDGKSTLIGRLLWESHQLFDDQLAALQADARRRGKPDEDIDFAFALDGLAAEREQGITIDVAYRFFGTPRRRFIVADTPGHEQYTRNMVTGASTAGAAVLLVDARKGLLTQTRRHAYLVRLMGVQHVLLAINKMDLVAYDARRFRQIEQDFSALAQELGLQHVTTIPVSALLGDNLTKRSAHMPWYSGPTLLGYLETVPIEQTAATQLAFPVQWVNRPDASFRGFSGTVAQGKIRVGDQIRVTASGQTTEVAEIVTMDGQLDVCEAGQAVTLRLTTEVDISRGDILSLAMAPIETTDQFEATVIWMSDEPGLVGRSYSIKLATQWCGASITGIKYRTNTDSLKREAAAQLDLNDICRCNIALTRPLAFDAYLDSKTMGGFILVDRATEATVAAGLIRHSLRRAQNVHPQMLTTSREHREQLNGHRAKVIWFTGLSGSGKSTIANALEIALHQQGKRTYILDGDNIRRGLNKDLGFTDADRVENIRRIVEVARLMLDAGLIVIVAFISPFQRERQMAREIIEDNNFVEVYVSTPLEVCEQRDVKGLYKKARSGLIPNMSGINSPYEPPISPDLTINSVASTVEENVATLMRSLSTNF